MGPLFILAALVSPEGVPLTGHSWLGPLERVFRWFVSWLTGGAKILPSDLVTFKPLAVNTYANGTAGVGATLTGNANGALAAIDGVPITTGLTIGVWGEVAPANNGLYVVTSPGTASAPYVLTRHVALDQAAELVPGTRIGVRSGTVYAGLTYEYTGVVAPTMGTTALTAAVNVKITRTAGVIPGSRLPLGANPTNGDTFVIGGKTFTFVTALGAVAANLQIKILGSTALTLAAAIDAINGVASDTNWAEATVPFAVAIVADNPTGNTLRIRGARSRGGDPVPAVLGSTALAATLTSAAAWTNDNLNLIGKADSDVLTSEVVITLDAAHITAMGTAGGLIVELPFTPTICTFVAISSAGVVLSTISDTVLPVAGGVQLLAAGATHLAATNKITIYAQQ